jgi:hypothetical protein
MRTHRGTPWLTWSLVGLYAIVVAATLGLVGSGAVSPYGALIVFSLGYGLVGCLVAIRKPGHAIGWLLLGTATLSGLAVLAEVYAERGYAGEAAAAVFANWCIHTVLFGTFVLLPLLFPTGRLLSPTWRGALWVGGVGLALCVFNVSLDEYVHLIGPREPIPNPLEVGGPLGAGVRAAYPVGIALLLTGFVLAATSLVVRMRRSGGRERQQLQVFAYAVGALALALFFASVPVTPDPRSSQTFADLAFVAAWLVALCGLPLAIGIAILRHRLFDIDVVINRTLVYGVLTVTLAAVYLGLILLFGLLLSPLTSDSDLEVAGSTLAVAALFQPARTRIQVAVDRRFFRHRYNASRTLEAFSSQLHDEFDLNTLAADLQRIAQETMQPVHVSLWLRDAGR